jgi:hypothetical protein
LTERFRASVYMCFGGLKVWENWWGKGLELHKDVIRGVWFEYYWENIAFGGVKRGGKVSGIKLC